MSTLPRFESDSYEDGRTKQAYLEATNINSILARAAKGVAISHLAKYEAQYGDFSDIDDLLTASQKIQRGQQIFSELPAEIRKEFDQDMGKFFRFVTDPKNSGELPRLLPQLTKPGRQLAALNRPDRVPEPPAGDKPPPADPKPESPPA